MLLKKPRRSLRGAQLRRHVAGDVAGLRVHPLNSVISDDAIVLEQLREAVTYLAGDVSQSR